MNETLPFTITLIAVAVSFLTGLLLGYLLRSSRSKTVQDVAQQIFKANQDSFLATVKDSFKSLSLDALSKSQDVFLKTANVQLELQSKAHAENLDKRKDQIEVQLHNMTAELGKVEKLVKELEGDRQTKFGELSGQLQNVGKQISDLGTTTAHLREALANNKVRGQWGERMAEDVLKLIGFVENVNYTKQTTSSDGKSRPDFTFMLPRNLKLNMDVKFPYENYIKYLDSAADGETHRKQFLKDVRSRITEIARKDYIDPSQQTVDCVLMFIPNEQIYRFIHAEDHSIIEAALEQKVVMCSPISLFAVLAVIRQAVENFAIEQSSRELLSLLGEFNKQWESFKDKMHEISKHIEKLQEAFGVLNTTRTRMLEKPLQQIEDLRTRRNIPLPASNGIMAYDSDN